MDDEGDDVDFSVHVLQSSQLVSVAFDACLLSEGVCWLISTLHSQLSQFRINQLVGAFYSFNNKLRKLKKIN